MMAGFYLNKVLVWLLVLRQHLMGVLPHLLKTSLQKTNVCFHEVAHANALHVFLGQIIWLDSKT